LPGARLALAVVVFAVHRFGPGQEVGPAAPDRISGQIAASLVGDLNRVEAERARQRGTDSLEAWSLCQLGLQLAIGRYSKEDFAAARDLFTRAAQRDPRFATTLAQRVFVDLWEVVMGWNDTPVETVELDPRAPAAQAALGWAYVMSGDIENGLIASRRAVEINPSMPEALGWLSWALLMAGDPEGCMSTGEQAIRLNPLGRFSSILYDNFSEAYWELGDYDAGLRAAQCSAAGGGTELGAVQPDQAAFSCR